MNIFPRTVNVPKVLKVLMPAQNGKSVDSPTTTYFIGVGDGRRHRNSRHGALRACLFMQSIESAKMESVCPFDMLGV